ncbi:MAG: D-alanyl-D-alanine carboxypeptidase [Clostridium sp.]|nr:D-alanyl-D-alanine carboxypeptidase [Clostridium sp.]MCM1444225.1 D-alanyl-D-alanine carboxypeptidase [Candidatus Amulumruptor caecigallinarius]
MKKIIILLILLIPINVFALETSATSAILMDLDNNRIIYSKDIHNIRSVASISKIMTALLAVESGKLNDNVTIGEEINSAYGSGIYIQVGENMRLIDLVYGLMLRSGNDAALAIAKYVGGSVDDFVVMMNDKAKEIGMKNTTFNNPSGLDQDKGNYSTAYDMALLTSYAMKNEDYKKIVGTKNYKLKTDKNYYSWINKNKLLHSYRYTTGGKTGYTEIARRTLVTTATQNGVNLVAVTLNDGNDFQDHKNMHEYGFNNYTNYKILSKGDITIIDENYYLGYSFYINNDFNYILTDDEKNTIKLKFLLEKDINKKDGDIVGKVHVYVLDKEVHSQDVYLKKEKIVKKNILQKILDWFRK